MATSSVAVPTFAQENGADTLVVPTGLILNRGHIEELAFGGPMGLSWDEVDGRESFTVFAFRNANELDIDGAYDVVEGINALYLDVNTAFAADLTDGPFWFRVQAVGAEDYSDLSVAMGPFWNTVHSDEFVEYPARNLEVFLDPDIPVILIDLRRPYERENQGNVVGDTHVIWPNAVAVEEGATHAGFQADILRIWENFIANDLTDAQRESLDPDLGYRDIHMFFF
jgi:hypothetical protein